MIQKFAAHAIVQLPGDLWLAEIRPLDVLKVSPRDNRWIRQDYRPHVSIPCLQFANDLDRDQSAQAHPADDKGAARPHADDFANIGLHHIACVLNYCLSRIKSTCVHCIERLVRSESPHKVAAQRHYTNRTMHKEQRRTFSGGLKRNEHHQPPSWRRQSICRANCSMAGASTSEYIGISTPDVVSILAKMLAASRESPPRSS